jgi:dienelactone hydrolase
MRRRTLLFAVTGCALLALATRTPAKEAAMTQATLGQAQPPRDLDAHHCMLAPPTLEAWKTRAAELRRRVLVSAGLWPMPRKTPLNPMVTGRTEYEDFIVENVAIETLPGFWLCGNLYLPKGQRGPFPAIVNPHGHWGKGRLEIQEDVAKAPPPPGKMGEGRANLPAIGVDLARAGFVVFAYDMVGYNDTNQVSHGFAGTLEQWFSGVSIMGLQLWNSIRAVDYVCSRPDVDAKRIGVTGASGGGSQTFLLAAVDDRIKASVPVNMVSAYMQGGCLCENGPGLRIGTDNVEIGALAAPRPQLVIAATGDWTKRVPEEEWPAIRAVYALYGAADRTACRQFNYGHNYNVESREAMVTFFMRWLKPHRRGAPEPVFTERPFSLDTAAMRVWSAEKPRPAAIASDAELTAAIKTRAAEAIANASSGSPAGFRALMQPALRTALGIPEPPAGVAPRPPAGRALLIVRPRGAREEEANRLADLLRSRATTVAVIEVDTEPIEPKAWWDKFRSCYNVTPFGMAAGVVADHIGALAGKARRVDVVGVGTAGLAALFGRAVVNVSGALIVDMDGVNPVDEAAMLPRAYAPCLMGLGGVPTAVRVAQAAPTVLYALPFTPDRGLTQATSGLVGTTERWDASAMARRLTAH